LPDAEFGMAEACRRYMEGIVSKLGLAAGREELAAGLENLYARRLGLADGRERAEGIAALLTSPRSILLEMAHDGQLPHLGIVRLVLKTHDLAMRVRGGLTLYLVGNHYTAAMRPSNLLIGMPLRGVEADRVKNPLTIPVGRKGRSVPFRLLPPPARAALDALERRADDWLVNNATHASRVTSLDPLRAEIQRQFDLLRDAARATQSFGDWLLRVQISWLDSLLGTPDSRLAVLPMSGIVDWVPEILEEVALEEEKLTAVKQEVSRAQRSRGETPYASGEPLTGSFWVYCPACHRRYRSAWTSGGFEAECLSCERDITAFWPRDASRVMPDIIAYEIALFRMGISGWVVGSRAPYHPVIEQSYKTLYGIDMPPKFFQTTIPRFFGLGEPSSGDPRARLMRVLMEVDPSVVRQALMAPWDVNPEIRSPFP
jgi:hypothetical protein